MNRHLKPCDNCTKVERPDRCKDANCQEWKAWFVSVWDDVRTKILQFLNNQTEEHE